jgi:catechol 2,3-dioxygenase-like lactoylglutathione lyase family enzyme
MANLDNLRKRAKTLLKQHRERYYPVAAKLRQGLKKFAALSDAEILNAPFALADAQAIVARDAGFASWGAASKALKHTPARKTASAPKPPRLCTAYPQLIVTDVARAAAFYAEKLGFKVAYLYGKPPFYGLVERDSAGLNLRHMDKPVIDQSLRERETLLDASIPVEGVKALYLEFQQRGVDFAQPLKLQPWGAWDFILRDPDGNLIAFGSAIPSWQE